MKQTERPLSPHLSIYRWPITMTLSILHRITGVGLSVGLIVFAVWLMHAAAGPEEYQVVRAVMSSLAGRLMLIGWSFAFFLHLCNGIRHLVWDIGFGFEKSQADAGAWLALLLAAAMTLTFWSTM